MIWNAEEIPAAEMFPNVKAGQRLLHATTAWQVYSIRALFRFQIEGASFIGRRFWDDLKLIETLRSSEEFIDAFDVFVNFFQNAAFDYANEVGELASIGAKIASETGVRARNEVKTTIDDMAAATIAP